MKRTRKITSIVLAVLMVLTTLVVSVGSASAATSSGSEVYFDNSKFGWKDVYVYAYGTKENAEWPGELMTKEDSGLYKTSFASSFKSEKIIFNNGLEKGEGKEQYPEAAGLSLNAGECKMLTAEKQWIDYGKPDDHAYGYILTANNTAFSTESLDVKLALKNADKGYYSVDGSAKKEFVNGDSVKVGEGKIGNSRISLTLYATGADGVETEQTYTFKKTFTASKTTFSAKSDGHTTEPEGGYYGTNPEMQLGKHKTISVDGDLSDWDSSMIIAQGVANDDPRVYMPSSMHEQPWDAYALYSAWDEDNLYFLLEMANTTYITSPEDNFAASNEARPWRNSIPMYLALSIDPAKQATGKAVGTNKDGSVYTNPFVWGCTNGTAKDGGTGFTSHIDTLVAFDSNNSNGGASIFKADTKDTDGTYMFNYDTRIPIGVTSFQAQDNKNGFKIKYANGTKSTSIFGINAPKGSRVLGDNLDMNSNWVDFFDEGYKNSYGFVYEIAVPLNTLGIDRSYIETQGIGAMQILTYGTSGMDTLPHDPSMLDQANLEYSYDPSTSHEKEDIDNITVPLARIGALLPDTEVTEAPFEVNFGANLNSGQSAGTPITLSAESYHAKGDVTYTFTVNGTEVQNSASDSYVWTPTADGTYSIGVVAVDGNGNKAESVKTFVVGSAPVESIKGDVNHDGIVNVVDATLVQKYVVSLVEFDSETLKVADVNGDGEVNVVDSTLIQKMVLGLA
nr:starch-binding protein [uncultured Ruminococcus sp.]